MGVTLSADGGNLRRPFINQKAKSIKTLFRKPEIAINHLALADVLNLMSPGIYRSIIRCLIALACFCSHAQAQVVEDFEIRYQAQQNGGIQFLANTTMYCGTGSACTAAQQAMPITGWPQDNNNGHSMEYFDGDNDPDTWCSSSDSLALGPCAEVSFAGLYWAGRLGNGFVPNAAMRDQVKIRASDTDPYIDVFAEQEIEFNASQVNNYCCYADITDWVSGNPVNARYTVANVIAREASSCWGGWVLVIVYEDEDKKIRR